MNKSKTVIKFVFPLFTAAALTLLILKLCGFAFSWLWIPAVWLFPVLLILGIILGLLAVVVGLAAILLVMAAIVLPIYFAVKLLKK